MEDNQKQPYVVSSKSRVAVAINAASKTGEWIKTKLGSYKQLDTKTSSQDLVTEVDKGAEQMIRKLVLTYCPEDEFLGEESAGIGAEASIQATENVLDAEYVWIVDPIDGTTNFVHGFPYYCVSIAVAHKGEVIVGVVYDPTHDELFVAEKGKGAYVHGNLMKVAGEKTLAESLVATGFPANAGLERNTRALVEMVPKVRSIRNGGSAALHLAYVAAGRLNAYWEVGLNAWDLAAGALLVQEAGGRIGDISGEEYKLTVRNVAATNGHIHEELIRELHTAGLTDLPV
ncbi:MULTISPECIES: inositol monophosphatase family protein [Paenibacillus]|uniref:inositol monophosphatase family protein n=1 Tax=Paenibacillus TaxID=44249 RepID=UPI00037761BE|nr:MULTISPECIES: inositol monophosphatase family protein [Paenibacillus]